MLGGANRILFALDQARTVEPASDFSLKFVLHIVTTEAVKSTVLKTKRLPSQYRSLPGLLLFAQNRGDAKFALSVSRRGVLFDESICLNARGRYAY